MTKKLNKSLIVNNNFLLKFYRILGIDLNNKVCSNFEANHIIINGENIEDNKEILKIKLEKIKTRKQKMKVKLKTNDFCSGPYENVTATYTKLQNYVLCCLENQKWLSDKI